VVAKVPKRQDADNRPQPRQGSVYGEKGMIVTNNLTKFYGDFPAIQDVSFQVKKGETVGFLGPNGAGKTTTMRVITGFLPPTSGTATIGGHDVVEESLEARKLVGYLPESVPLYTDMTVEAYLRFSGTLRAMNPKHIKQRASEVIEICRLGDYYRTHIGKLSKGFRQRVGIAQAILHRPEVLILDEPTIGIDPIQVVETRDLIKELGRENTVILSTHILPEVSTLCQRVLIINEGQIVAEDTPKNLAQRLQGLERLDVEVLGPAGHVANALKQVNGVVSVSYVGEGERNNFSLQLKRGSDLRDEISRAVISGGWSLLGLSLVNMSLEEIFLKLTATEEPER
jgi:ABC-2 type transport system ATP-binding protein